MTETTNGPERGTDTNWMGASTNESTDRSEAPSTGGPVLDLDDGPPGEEGPPPECAVDGCHREGNTPKKMPVPGRSGEAADQYVCRYHRTLFLGVRALIVALAVALFVLVYVGVR